MAVWIFFKEDIAYAHGDKSMLPRLYFFFATSACGMHEFGGDGDVCDAFGQPPRSRR